MLLEIDEYNSIENALRLAYENNRADLVRWLIGERESASHIGERVYHIGDDRNHISDVRRNTLMWASRCGHTDIVRRLLDSDDRNTREAMHNACEHGHIEIVRMLIVESQKFISTIFHISSIHRGNSRCLISACAQGHTEIVRLLLPLQTPEESENEALQISCKNGHAETVRLLLNNPFTTHINPAAKNNKAFELACEYGHTEIVRLLLDLPPERGVNPATIFNRAHLFPAAVLPLLIAKFPRFAICVKGK